MILRWSPAMGRIARAGTLVALAVLTVLAIRLPGTGDMEIWERWISNASRLGVLAGFAENAADYPPGASVVLWTAGSTGAALGWAPAAAIKCSLAVFLGATLIAFFAWTRHGAATLSLWAVVLLNSVALGYLDIYTAPFLVLSLRALSESRHRWALAWFSVASLVKWQPGLVGPFLLLHVIGTARRPTREDARRVARLLAPSAAVVGVVVLAFGTMPVAWAFARSMGHRSLSADALNLGWVITWLQQGATLGGDALFDRVVYLARAPLWTRLATKALFAIQFVLVVWHYLRRPADFNRTLAHALMGSLAYLIFNSGVHENHWFVPTLLAVALAARDATWRVPALITGGFANLNLLLFYGFSGQGPGDNRVIGIDVTVPLAALAVAFYVWMWTLLRRPDGSYSSSRQ